MKKLLLHPVFIFCATLSGINKLIELNGFYIPVVHSYMDDLFCMPVMLTATLFLMRRFVYNDEQYVFSKGHVLAAIVYCSVVFELILPMQSNQHTADALDVLAYLSGGIIFYKFINLSFLIPQRHKVHKG